MNSALLQEIDDTQRVIDCWYQQSSANLQASYATFVAQLRQLEQRLSGGESTAAYAAADVLATPNRPIYMEDALLSTPPMASPPAGRGVYSHTQLLDELVDKSAPRTASSLTEGDLHKRPDPGALKASSSAAAPNDVEAPCQVLVEFKRKRILQYESPYYVAPGEYVVVGGDRGEDIGLVTHSWSTSEASQASSKAWVEGVGKVLRVASVLEVTQLQGVQTELEGRAVEVAQEKAQEHNLPMRIVDAEYQFDRRKLTFYYQSQHRLDFRNLVRDLYKTFRARIWMEPDVASSV